jgi:hypothetical protein
VGKLTGSITESSINASASIQSYAKNPNSSAGTAYAGGIAGYSGGTINKTSFTSYSGGVSAGFFFSNSNPPTPEVYAKDAYAGGIAGDAAGAISQSYANIAPSDFDPVSSAQAGIDARIRADGIAAAGGIAGKNVAGISESYAVVTVQARAETVSTGEGALAGGISGMSGGTISKTFALAQIDARPMTELISNSKARAGGIAGLLFGTSAKIEQSYAAGSVSAHSSLTSAQSGGIAGFVDSSAVEACVALQRFVASNGANNRVVGINNSGTLADNYAYIYMRPYNDGSPIIVPSPDATDVNGDNILRAGAIDIEHYLDSLGWDGAVWKASSSGNYPVLVGLPEPSFPSWAVLP